MSAPVTSSCISHEIIIGILSIHTLLHLKRFNTNDRTSQEICDTITLGVLGLFTTGRVVTLYFPLLCSQRVRAKPTEAC